jgi:vacuolar-type H+-ATPase subunit E/Vma4
MSLQLSPYTEIQQVIEQLRQQRLLVLKHAQEEARLNYQLKFVQAKLERALIRQVGDEKLISPNLEGRERVFILARDSDPEYKTLLAQLSLAEELHEKAKIEVQFYHDKMAALLAFGKGDLGNV